jgi:O-antigen biosynthesis protein
VSTGLASAVERRVRGGIRRIRAVGGPARRSSSSLPRSIDELPDLVGGPEVRHDPALDATPSLVVLMPHLATARMTGGPNTVFQLTERLAARGQVVRYVACFGPLDHDIAGLRHHLQEVTGLKGSGRTEFIDCSAPTAHLAVGRGDVLMATWWPTAYVANRGLAATGLDEFVYLIQDFEPGFHPWSTKYALAAATYRLRFRAVVNEPTLLEHLREHGELTFDSHDQGRAIAFMPAVDRTVFRPGQPLAGRRRLVFYARPRHPRNLFELGLRALAVAADGGAFDAEAWEFGAIGEEDHAWALTSRHTLVPVPRLTYRDYGAYLGSSDLLLSLMLSPHTSYPPLEMATAGGLVVTNTFSSKTTAALAAISPAIRGVPADVDRLATAIAQAALAVEAGRPPSSTTLPGSWTEALEKVVPWLERTIDVARRAPGS